MKTNKKLQLAVKNANIDYVLNALKYDKEDASLFDSALLCVGVRTANIAIIKVLVESGANPSARKNLALRASLVYNKIDIAKYLVTVGADINAVLNTEKGHLLSDLLSKSESTVGIDFSITGQISLRDSIPKEDLDFDITGDVKLVTQDEGVDFDVTGGIPVLKNVITPSIKSDFDFDVDSALLDVESTQRLRGKYESTIKTSSIASQNNSVNGVDDLDFDITGNVEAKEKFSKTANKMKHDDFDFDITDMGYETASRKEVKDKIKPVSSAKDDFPDIDLSLT